MDARFEIEEQGAQVHCAETPVLPQVMGQKAHQHGPGAEVQVARGLQAAHTGINIGEAGCAFAPGPHQRVIVIPGVCVEAFIDVLKLHPAFTFKFLDKVAVPMQSRLKGGQGSAPSRLLLPCRERLVNLANG